MITRRTALVDTRIQFLLAAVMALSLTNLALAAKIDAERVFQAAVGFLEPDRFKAVRSAYAAPDGAIWIVGVDWNWGRGRRDWYVRHLGSDGSCPRGDMPVFPCSETGLLTGVVPVGTMPDGNLVVDLMEMTPEGKQRLAKVSPSGATAVSDVLPSHGPHEPFVFIDRDGVAHLVVGSTGPAEYAQVDMAAKGMPVIRMLDYDQPFNGYASVPGYLRWRPWRGEPLLLAFCSERSGRILAATLTPNDSFSHLHLYRVNTKTLALVDSGAIHLTRDVYRAWSGPTIRRTVIVPADKSGFWVYRPMPDTSPAPTIVAYRVQPDLKVVRPTAVDAGTAKPFDAASADAVVSIECPYVPPRTYGGGKVQVKLRLKFTAFGSDGQLYYQAFEDSLTSRVTE